MKTILLYLATLFTSASSPISVDATMCDLVHIVGRHTTLSACSQNPDALSTLAEQAARASIGDTLSVCSNGVCEPVDGHPLCCDETGCGPAIGCDMLCCILTILDDGCGGCVGGE